MARPTKVKKEIEARQGIPRQKLHEMGFSRISEATQEKNRLMFYRCGAVVVILYLWFDGGWDLYIPASLKNDVDSQFKELEILINS